MPNLGIPLNKGRGSSRMISDRKRRFLGSHTFSIHAPFFLLLLLSFPLWQVYTSVVYYSCYIRFRPVKVK